jgi:hypothetical protein
MVSKKVLLFSRDPGGANVVIPLVEPLTLKGYQVKLFGKDVALGRYDKAGLSAFNILDFVQYIKPEDIKEFLKNENPDFIITGTSADDFTEKYLWKSAENLGIPSFAIIDQWINYGIRFSRYSISQSEEYNRDKTHPYLPAKILVMNEIARQEAVKDGLEYSRIEVTGSPHLEWLLRSRAGKSVDMRNKFAENADDFIISFASEPISQLYSEPASSDHYWGYTEQTIFQTLLNALDAIAASYSENIIVVIKMHPKEKEDNYQNILDQSNHVNIKIFIEKDIDPYDLMLTSDLICGMSSMFLIEAAVLGKPILSIQIGLKRENPFILDRIGVLQSILDEKNLKNSLKDLIIDKHIPAIGFDVIMNSSDRIINLMEKYLCPG